MSETRARELWEMAEDMPDSPAKVDLLEEAIREADSASWLEGSYDIRTLMIEAAAFSGRVERLLTAFSWCLAKADELPQQFDEEELLWPYKWAISGALSFPGIALSQMQEMLGDFSRRLTKFGYSQRPVFSLRYRIQQIAGNLDQAVELAKDWQDAARDDISDCEACELNHMVSLACDRHEHATAVERAAPLLSGEKACLEIPHDTYPELLVSAMREGDDAQAKRFHLRGYRMVYRGADFLRALGMHGLYLARTNDAKKGLDLIEKHIHWALDSVRGSARRDFMVGALAIMRAVANSGVSKAALRLPSSHPLHTDGGVDVHAMIQWLEQDVREICEAFDRRHGNSYVSDEANHWLELAR